MEMNYSLDLIKTFLPKNHGSTNIQLLRWHNFIRNSNKLQTNLISSSYFATLVHSCMHVCMYANLIDANNCMIDSLSWQDISINFNECQRRSKLLLTTACGAHQHQPKLAIEILIIHFLKSCFYFMKRCLKCFKQVNEIFDKSNEFRQVEVEVDKIIICYVYNWDIDAHINQIEIMYLTDFLSENKIRHVNVTSYWS